MKRTVLQVSVMRGSRTPYGVRGLKRAGRHRAGVRPGRTPYGVRGLKPTHVVISPRARESHPVRGAWIETWAATEPTYTEGVAPRTGCVD